MEEYNYNHIPKKDVPIPIEKFSGTNFYLITHFSSFHTWGFPVYVLEDYSREKK